MTNLGKYNTTAFALYDALWDAYFNGKINGDLHNALYDAIELVILSYIAEEEE